ncbi:LOW QUALITY PROTEIN: cis-aconitate decarboxylase, partial [Clarias gariepinus]
WYQAKENSSVKPGTFLPPQYAAFVNGILEVIVIQENPCEHEYSSYTPAKLLRLSPSQIMAALAIACSSAGAPLVNAAIQTNHLGNAAQRGLEAAQLALLGLESNKILDLESGFNLIFYQDYFSFSLLADVSQISSYRWVLEEQDVAFKRFPAHLCMHWVAEAAVTVRNKIYTRALNADLSQIEKIVLRVLLSRYIDCPLPVTEHEVRHTYQFNCCSAHKNKSTLQYLQ